MPMNGPVPGPTHRPRQAAQLRVSSWGAVLMKTADSSHLKGLRRSHTADRVRVRYSLENVRWQDVEKAMRAPGPSIQVAPRPPPAARATADSAR